MNEKQLETIVGLIGACETAIVTMAEYLARQNLIDKSALADHFDAKALLLPVDVHQRNLFDLVLRQVAAGLRAAPAGSEHEAIAKHLH